MRLLLLSSLIFVISSTYGQSPMSSGFFNYHLTDRYEILSDSMTTEFFTGVKPYRRDAISNYTNALSTKNATDNFNKAYLRRDNIIFDKNPSDLLRKPILKKFYNSESAWFLVNEDRFKLVTNPVLGLTTSQDKSDSISLYNNTRGAEIFGNIGNKVGFYSRVLENQTRFPNYIRDKHDQSQVINGATLHKPFGVEAEDYFNVAGHITFSPLEEITVQFGNDKNFIGNGYRSLIMSDITAPYPFLKLNTKVWKINYMNLFSQHIDFIKQGESVNNGRKFSAFHHLSMNLGKNLTLGVFENIIFDRADSNESNQYEVSYLNPVIFYRAVEHGLNSSDNASLGLDIKWNFLNHFSLYGQYLLDEFVKDEMFGRTESWVNKWAYQAGVKYINVANVNNLDLQLEINQVRPYFNQHRTRSQNWIHYNQSLAHPLGSNVREMLSIIRYQPTSRLSIRAMVSHSLQGVDSNMLSVNYGGNYLRSYIGKPSGAAPMFHGIKNTVTTSSIHVSYMLWHNLFIDADYVHRVESNELWLENRNNSIINIGLRLNMSEFEYRQ